MATALAFGLHLRPSAEIGQRGESASRAYTEPGAVLFQIAAGEDLWIIIPPGRSPSRPRIEFIAVGGNDQGIFGMMLEGKNEQTDGVLPVQSSDQLVRVVWSGADYPWAALP